MAETTLASEIASPLLCFQSWGYMKLCYSSTLLSRQSFSGGGSTSLDRIRFSGAHLQLTPLSCHSAIFLAWPCLGTAVLSLAGRLAEDLGICVPGILAVAKAAG